MSLLFTDTFGRYTILNQQLIFSALNFIYRFIAVHLCTDFSLSFWMNYVSWISGFIYLPVLEYSKMLTL